jgi:BirA family biotin operon repressor/biotin-[acetyl-CoA-carboxylase] ligase
VALETVDSTNDEALRLAAEGAEDGTLVWAREQTGGRGRQGRSWSSPPGNLYFSLVLRPDCAPAEAAQLGFVAGLALGEAIGSVALGLGANLQHFPEDTSFPATSLRSEGATEVDVVALLEAFGRYFMSWVNRWLDEGFAPVRRAWLHHAHGLGEEIEVRLPRETLKGTFKDLDARGVLLLELPGGETREISAGDVYFGA